MNLSASVPFYILAPIQVVFKNAVVAVNRTKN